MSGDDAWFEEDEMEYEDYGDSDAGAGPSADGAGSGSSGSDEDDDDTSRVYLEDDEPPAGGEGSSRRGRLPYTIINRDSLKRMQVGGVLVCVRERVWPVGARAGGGWFGWG